MPKAKTKTSSIPPSQASMTNGNANCSDSEDEASTQSGTAAQKAFQTMTSADRERRINDLVQYLLIMDQKKFPIKKADINKAVLKDHSRAYAEIMKRACERLKDVFGIMVKEFENKKQKCYILVNELDNDHDDLQHLHCSADEQKKTGLLMIILTLISTNEDCMTEAQLFNTLSKLGVNAKEPHKMFGDVTKLVTQQFVRQGYLVYTKIPLTDPPEYEFHWGPRAQLETSPEMVKAFIKQVCGT